MRSMGYSFESAIADIVDNSISAKANIIELKLTKKQKKLKNLPV